MENSGNQRQINIMESFRSNAISMIKAPQKSCQIKFVNSVSSSFKSKIICMATNVGFSLYQWSQNNTLELKEDYLVNFQLGCFKVLPTENTHLFILVPCDQEPMQPGDTVLIWHSLKKTQKYEVKVKNKIIDVQYIN